MMNLSGRRILVTGASRGLGKAMCGVFELEGATVTGWSRTSHKSVTDRGRIMLDATLLNIDVLVCNAAIGGPVGRFDLNHPDEWAACLEVNLLGVVNCCRAFIPQMRNRNEGKIVIVSGGGAVSPRPNFSAYATSKAAVVRFMECIAEELKPWNIDANCLAPGLLNTGIHNETLLAGPQVVGQEEWAKAVEAKGAPLDFTKACDLALWLASDESNGITGRLIHVNQDYKALKP